MKRLAFLLTLLIPVFTFSQIINIPDDYPTIQQGIDAANDGDTVLVETGTYVENLNFDGKNITVSSLYITTQDTSYISQTIIDGDQDGSVVVFESGEDSTAIICGFTIKNGYSDGGGGIVCASSSPTIDFVFVYDNRAYQGGGIWLSWSNPVISNSRITNNWASGGYWKPWGGGIYCENSNPRIENVLIKNNSAAWWQTQFIEGIGGGIYGDINSGPILKKVSIIDNFAEEFAGGISLPGVNTIFDSIDRCNIYNNINGDIGVPHEVSVFIDTFTVSYPTPYYGGSCHPDFNINVGLIELIDADLFVSPAGSNNNSGLTIDDPLKTIKYAKSILLYDCDIHHNIYLLEGTYSKNTNGESFPIVIGAGLSLINISDTVVTLNANNNDSRVLYLGGDTITFSDFTITGGGEGGVLCLGSVVNLSNLNIVNNGLGAIAYGGLVVGCDLLYMSDMRIENNLSTFHGGGASIGADTAYLQNLIISENTSWGTGGGIKMGFTNAILQNCLIDNNIASSYGQSRPDFGGGGIYSKNSSFSIINTTISNNYSGFSGPVGGGGGIYHDGYDSEIINSIIYGNEPQEIKLMGYDTIEVELNISYSNIKNGIDSISIIGENAHINWLEGNINEDPIFVNSGIHPFQINDYSLCIDAGTPDTIGLNLPDYDLAGEVRIFNDRVDMGAYEWNPIVDIEETSMPERDNLQVNCFPNPFTSDLTLEYTIQRPETIILTFYNQFGKEVDRIEQKRSVGKQQLVWAPELPGGVYYFRLEAGEQIVSGKVVLVR